MAEIIIISKWNGPIDIFNKTALKSTDNLNKVFKNRMNSNRPKQHKESSIDRVEIEYIGIYQKIRFKDQDMR